VPSPERRRQGEVSRGAGSVSLSEQKPT